MLIIIGSKILTNFNEECHHVEQLLNIDAAVAILVKQVEHLHNVKKDDDVDGKNDDDDDDNDDNDDDLAEVVLSLAITEKVEEHPNCVQS